MTKHGCAKALKIWARQVLRDRRSGCIGTIVTGTHHGTTILQRHGVCGLRHEESQTKKGSAVYLETIWGFYLIVELLD